MKAGVDVSVEKARRAVFNHRKHMAEGKAMLLEGIKRFHTEVFPTRGVLHRWLNKKLSDREYARYMAGWRDISEVIWVVFTTSELTMVEEYEQGGYSRCLANDLDNLCQAADFGVIFVDQEYANFINTWGTND